MSDPSASPGRRPSEARRLTAMSDWAGMSAETRAKVEAQMAARKANSSNGNGHGDSSTLARNPEEWVLNEPTPDIKDFYTFGRQLGQPGQFGRALLAEHKSTGVIRAVKVVSKLKFSRLADRRMHFSELRGEINILKNLSHPNIIQLFDVYEDASDLYIVTEMCSGGELFDRIKAQPSGAYSEKAAAKILYQICSGLKYLHKHKIVHCDLKPDNFLFVDSADDSTLKIIDFGMSKYVKRRQYFRALRGTPYYIAPEVIKGQYNEACDMWSFGVVMFVMLFGYPPFHAENDNDIFNLILNGFAPIVKKGYRAHFPMAIPCSDAAKDLISKLLTMDTAKRLTAEEALEHPWLTGVSADTAPMVSEVIYNLRNFSSHSKFKQGILNLMVNTLSEVDIQKLKKFFYEIDANHDGKITVFELSQALEKSGAAVVLHTEGEDSSSASASSSSSAATTPTHGQQRLSGGRTVAQEVERILKQADIDGDGTLSYNELVLSTVQRKLSAKEERLWHAFCKLDLNRDGQLSGNEIMQVLGESSNEACKMIEEADKNGDGKIDFDEFLDVWLAHQTEQEKKKFFTSDDSKFLGAGESELPPGGEKKSKA